MANPDKPVLLVLSDSLQPYQKQMLEIAKSFDFAKHSLLNVNHVYGKMARPPRTYEMLGHVTGQGKTTEFGHYTLKRWFEMPKRLSKGYRKHIRKLKAAGKLPRTPELKRKVSASMQKQIDKIILNSCF